jgi:hypothetical protein
MAKRKKVAPKDRLEEITVQKRAQTYLEQYYKIKHGQQHLFSNIEERTKKKFGMKRADGLLAYKLNKRRAYVVSMEAKSHKTLPALRPYRVNKVWVRDSIWKSFLFTLATGVLFFAWRQDGWLVLMPFVVWFLAALVHMLPVVEIDGQSIGSGGPGEVYKKLRGIYLDIIHESKI